MNQCDGTKMTAEMLLEALNDAKRAIYGTECRPLTMSKLYYHAFDTRHRAYIDFRIPKKKRGEYRTISAPCPGLKCIQTCLNKVLSDAYEPHAAAMGFVRGRSVADNARVHAGQRFVYNIDLKDFFPSIKGSMVRRRLQAEPFGMDAECARLVVQLCCGVDEEGKEVLPQGAPTSPVLSNLVCERMDGKLNHLAEAYQLRYTRYADDITFSGTSCLFDADGKFCQALRHIVEAEEHLTINDAKTRVRGRGRRQEVTGLTANDAPNVSKEYVKQIRTMLHNWETKGYRYAQRRMTECSHPTKRPRGRRRIENVLAGKLAYMRMVKGEEDQVYRKLQSRFEALRVL